MLLLAAVPATLLGFAGLGLFFYFFTAVPLPEDVGARPTVLLDSAGREVGTLQPEISREDVALEELPDHVRHAVLAAEDATFYEHRGVSLLGIVRAAVRNVAGGQVRQGGSTISQQYIKNVTTDKERSLLRKVREAALAVKLERRYSKDEILEFYLNSIYWGRGAYGVEAAARAYFGKPAARLTVAEAAQLAGVIAAPSAYEPRRDPQAAQRRYVYVLDQMVDKGWLDPVVAGRRAARPPATRRARGAVFKQAPFFLQLVQDELERKLGPEEIFQGMVVTTTLDLELQEKAEESYTEAFVESGIKPGGALVAIDNATGGIRALVGGKDFGRSQLNLALARRQPGSTFKPFALAAWIDEGNSPESYFDAPAEIVFTEEELEARLGRDQPPGTWEPENFEGAAYGALSLREATWKSVNTVYAQLILEVGPERAKQIARQAGIRSKLAAVPSIVLGTSGVTPVELTQAYATFATGGIRRDAHTVTEVRRDGEPLHQADADGERALSEQVALTVTDVLRGVVTAGSGMAADIGRPAAGKTGTTQNNADAWFAGYTPQLTAVVWMGNVGNNKPMEGEYTGGSLPAQTWQDFMSAAMEGVEVADFPSPPGGLVITRPSPTPTPLACRSGEVASEDAAGMPTCAPAPPTEEPTQAAPTEVATEPEPEPEPEPTEPEPEPTEPEPEPTEPEPTEADPEPPPGDDGDGEEDRR